MKRNRFLFFIWISIWFIIWLTSRKNEALLVVAATVICVLADIFMAFHVAKRLKAQLRCLPSVSKDIDFSLDIQIENKSWFSCSRGKLEIETDNLLTGQKERRIAGLAVLGKSETNVCTDYKFSKCGRVILGLSNVICSDAFGLFEFSNRLEVDTAVLVLPQLYATRIEVSTGQVTDVESNEYSMYRSGFDAGETYALREYKAGDPVKNIHWKLSQKSEELILRELSLPVQNSLLVLMENEVIDNSNFDVDQAEALGEIAVSISMALCEEKYEHRIAWTDIQSNDVRYCDISCEEDLNGAMAGILSAGVEIGLDTAAGTAERLAAQKGELDYAHIIVITHSEAEPELPVSAGTSIVWIHTNEYGMFREKGIFAEV